MICPTNAKRRRLFFVASLLVLVGLGIIVTEGWSWARNVSGRNQVHEKARDREPEGGGIDPQYLVFQFFTYICDGSTAFSETKLNSQVSEVINALEGLRGDGKTRQLGFGVGPLSLDQTDHELREVIRESFKIAEQKDVAVLFHIDDSMFWRRRSDLWKDPRNVEWADWTGTVYPRRYVDWALPIKLAPQMCYNSPAIRREIGRIAREVIGREIKKGIDSVAEKNKGQLFAGVIAGWETHLRDYGGPMPREMAEIMDRDGSPRVRIGYNALTNLRFSAANPPKDFQAEMANVVHDWAEFWARELNEAGIPKERVYTHFAGPTWQAFNSYARPGFSVYTAGQFEGIYPQLEKHGNPRWACAEGTNLDGVMMGFPWEAYLGRMFNHGASLATIFAWHEKDSTPYGKATNSKEAIAAYRKFLQGGSLSEKLPELTSLQKKFERIRRAMGGPQPGASFASGQKVINREQLLPLMQQLQHYMAEQKTEEAEKVADEILELIEPK